MPLPTSAFSATSRGHTQGPFQPLPACTCHMALLGVYVGECKREAAIRERNGAPTFSRPTSPDSPSFRRPMNAACPVPGHAPLDYPPLPVGNDDFVPLQPVKTRELANEEVVPALDLNADKHVIRRKLSKNTAFWKRSSKTQTMGTVESIESPRFMWDKYLQHCNANELDWLLKQFEMIDMDQRGRITVEEAMQISVNWNELNHEFEIKLPGDETVQAILTELGKGVTLRHLNFEHLVSFVRSCETKCIQADPRAGIFSDDLQDLLQIFNTHSTVRVRKKEDGTLTDEQRRSLSNQDTFRVLEALGRETSTNETQVPIVAIIKEMDVDKSGDLDWGEFLQFIQKVRSCDAVAEREREHKLITNSGFTDQEMEDFQKLFHSYAERKDGLFFAAYFGDILDGILGEVDKAKKAALKPYVCKFGNLETEDSIINFGEFIGILKQLLDNDVCGMKSTADATERKKQHQMDEDRRFLSPEDFEQKYWDQLYAPQNLSNNSSWVRRMVDKKAARRTSVQVKKDAQR